MFDPLLFIRGFSAVAILLYHMQYPGVRYLTVAGHDISWITSSNGFSFVWIFFILSGYVIGKSFISRRYVIGVRSLGTFFVKRFLRIAPYFYIIFLVNMVLYTLWTARRFGLILFQIATFTAQDWMTKPGIDYLWTVSTEMQCYLVAPILAFVFTRLKKPTRRETVFLLMVTLCVGALQRYHGFGNPHPPSVFHEYIGRMYTSLKYNLDFFVFGFLLNFLNVKTLSAARRLIPHIVLWTLMVSFLVFSGFVRNEILTDFEHAVFFHAVLFPIATTVFTGFLIIFAEYHWGSKPIRTPLYPRGEKLWKLALPGSFMSLVGFYSFELYLVHLPMTRLGLHCSATGDGCTIPQFVSRFTLLFAYSLITAIFFHHAVRSIMDTIGRKARQYQISKIKYQK